jgi:hypothetical protein
MADRPITPHDLRELLRWILVKEEVCEELNAPAGHIRPSAVDAFCDVRGVPHQMRTALHDFFIKKSQATMH